MNERPRDGQAQPRTFLPVPHAGLNERIEDADLVLGWDSWSGVGHFEREGERIFGVLCVRAHHDATLGRVFHSIANKIYEHLPQLTGIRTGEAGKERRLAKD